MNQLFHYYLRYVLLIYIFVSGTFGKIKESLPCLLECLSKHSNLVVMQANLLAPAKSEQTSWLWLRPSKHSQWPSWKAHSNTPHTQDQNGAAEVHGKHLLVRARSIRIHSRQPYDLWPEHVRCACVLSNKTPMGKLQWKTPFEIVYGKKPTIHYLVSPGRRAYVLNKSIAKNLKTDPRAFVGYQVGYEGTNIYRVWIPSQKRVVRTRDVHFDEKNHEYNPTEPDNSILYPEAIEAKIVIRQPPVNSGGLEDLDGTIDLPNNQELELEGARA